MKFWFIFGYYRWSLVGDGECPSGYMHKGKPYVPLFFGLWIRAPWARKRLEAAYNKAWAERRRIDKREAKAAKRRKNAKEGQKRVNGGSKHMRRQVGKQVAEIVDARDIN
jgi:hypothetical protein